MAFEGIKWGQLVEAKQLRRGGMADVFLVKRSFDGFERSFVLKRIQQRFVKDKLARDLFRAEARLHAAFEHPNIVQLLDFGTDGNFLYMVLEYVSGGDLFANMRRFQDKEAAERNDLILRGFEEVSSALSVVHQKVIHSDISPCNILVSANLSFKLHDFGLARRLSGASSALPGAGKVRYMAPELVGGAQSDARSDLFSLGASMAQAYSGRTLYGECSSEAVLRLLRSGAYLTFFYDLKLPSGLSEIVLRCVQPNPRDRYQNAMDLMKAISIFRAQNTLDSSRSFFEPALVTARPEPPARHWAKVISALLLLPIGLLVPWLSRVGASKGLAGPSERLFGRRPS